MAVDFNKFNEQFGGKQAVEELGKARENQYVEVPDGIYECCKLDNLELAESKAGKPMIKGCFRIVEGKFKKSCLFVNQVFTMGFPQHKGLEFLRSLNVFDASEIDFDGNFETFNDLLLDIAEESQALKFSVKKEKDGDFTRITVLDTYE